jgi:mannitol/fructose-specific phosphotransferase system IIA component
MHERTTHGIVHAGFRGFRAFVARKKGRSKLIGNRLVIPHDTILCQEADKSACCN